MRTIRTKIVFTDGSQPPWFASAAVVSGTDTQHIAKLNKVAEKRGVKCEYSLATEAEYWAYRKSIQ